MTIQQEITNLVLQADDGGGHRSRSNPFDVVSTNALVPPLIQSIVKSGDTVTLVWSAITGKIYRVQYRANPNSGNWADLPGDITATAGTAMKQDTFVSATQRLYRVLVLP